MSSPRSSPDSNRTGAALADYAQLLPETDHAEVAAHVRLVLSAPGPAILVWGAEAIVLAYNRAYRAYAAYRVSALERPLFKAQPEMERAWRPRLDQALAGVAAILEPADCVPAVSSDLPHRAMGSAIAGVSTKSSAGDVRSGWILPVAVSPGLAKGALILLLDVTPVVEPLRRAVALVAVELREALVGVRVLSERLSRAPKINPERFVGDVGRILEMATGMERTADDMTTFARFAGGTGVQISPRPGDLGTLVRAACDSVVAPADQVAQRSGSAGSPGFQGMYESSARGRLTPDPDAGPPSRSSAYLDGPSRGVAGSMFPGPSSSIGGPASSSRVGATSWLRVNVVNILGSWDPDAIRRIVINLVTVAHRYAPDSSEVSVELTSGREGAVLAVRADGRAPREDELEGMIEPWKRAVPSGDRRRIGSGLGLFVARELIVAHGGRFAWEQASPTTFALRVVLPPATPPRRF